MRKRLINFFSETTNVLLMISIIIGIVLIMLLNPKEAFTPPNEDDYKEVHYLEEKVKSNFNNVYSMENAEILINGENIIVEITSGHSMYYKISMEFDKERNFIESNEICTKPGFETGTNISKIMDKIGLILAWTTFTMCTVWIVYAFISVTLKMFSFVLKKIAIIFKKQKSRKKEN